MEEKLELFGKPILSNARLTLTEQVFDILKGEIQRGRWNVGERLPSITDVSRLGGLTRSPVQRAFQMLGEAGYIRQEDRRGCFLISVMPEGAVPEGAIGVALLLEHGVPQPHVQYLLHHVLEEVARKNYLTEVLYLKEDDDWEHLNTKHGPFSDRVKGIISLNPYATEDFTTLPEDRIPLVFVGPRGRLSYPSVTGNNWHGGYRLTRKVIERGHTDIILCSNRGCVDYSTRRFIEGHKAALEEKGLGFNQSALEFSNQFHHQDLIGYKKYFEQFRNATAVVALNDVVAQSLVSVADLLEIQIPRDLSLVCSGTTPMHKEHDKRQITSIEYPVHTVVSTGVEILEELMRTRQTNYSQVMVMPHYIEGDTLAVPKTQGAALPSSHVQAASAALA